MFSSKFFTCVLFATLLIQFVCSAENHSSIEGEDKGNLDSGPDVDVDEGNSTLDKNTDRPLTDSTAIEVDLETTTESVPVETEETTTKLEETTTIPPSSGAQDTMLRLPNIFVLLVSTLFLR